MFRAVRQSLPSHGQSLRPAAAVVGGPRRLQGPSYVRSTSPVSELQLQSRSWQSIRGISTGGSGKGWASTLASTATAYVGTGGGIVDPPPPPVASPKATSSAVLGASSSSSSSAAPAPPTQKLDPAAIIQKEMKSLSKNMKDLIGSGHPILDKVAKYYVQGEGKHMRPMIVLLMAQAASIAPKDDDWTKIRLGPSTVSGHMAKDVNASLSPLGMLADLNPGLSNLTKSAEAETELSNVLSTQKRLAEIVEMIHTASLLHDDVIDNADSRRGQLSGNLAFGNKMAVLAGDFLFGRASVALARLRDPEVVELVSTVIANLVEGEFMQLKNTPTDYSSPEFFQQTMEYYLQKSYLKTASLISKSCRASALLGGSTSEIADAAYHYGKNLGLAFQLVDDLLDFTVTEAELGKPSGADLKLGLATAPVLFALEKFPDLGPMIERKFDQPGDVEKARDYVANSDALLKTRQLAEQLSQNAINAISIFPESQARTSLEELARKALLRRK
ncbi:decaprenyl-diphosphate synthase subunit 1 [Peziza echinospora]|nr:decaprenyl-diphosphate synthase subunit 1 [Peziza echinospora]